MHALMKQYAMGKKAGGGFPADTATLNTSHFAYPNLIAAILPKAAASGNPRIYVGPAGGTFPTTWASGTPVYATNAGGNPALSFNGTAARVMITAIQSIFGGLANISSVVRFEPGVGYAPGSGVVFKDLEFSALQNNGAATWMAVPFNGAANLAIYPMPTPDNSVLDLGASYAGGTGAWNAYDKVNGGTTAASSGAFAAGNIATNATKPLCIGGDNVGVSTTGLFDHAFFFNTVFNAAQLEQLLVNPYFLFN